MSEEARKSPGDVADERAFDEWAEETGRRLPRGGVMPEYSPGDDSVPAFLSPGGYAYEQSRAAHQAEPGDRVLPGGVIDSVHDGFVMVQVDNVAPHAVPQRYGLVAVAHGAAATEAARADAALAVIFSNPCACTDAHAGSGACGAQADVVIVGGGHGYTPMCRRCAACVNSGAHPGRASGSASRARRTG